MVLLPTEVRRSLPSLAVVCMAAVALLLPAGTAQAVTYYWDNNGTAAGFGSAGGTWAAPTANLWSQDPTGVAAPDASVTTATSDGLNFGTATLGLGTGTITVSGAVDAGNMTFGSASAAITLSGGTINMGNSQITVNNTLDTIASVLAGTGTLTKLGTGTLALSGANTYNGGTTVTAGTLRGTVAGAFGANTGTAAISLGGGSLDLFNDAATTFTNTNTTVTANSTVTSNRATAGAGVTHTLGNLRIGAQTLNVTRGANATSGTGGITFGATTLTGNANFAPAANAQLNLGAVGGAFSLTKSGAGTAVLTATSTYTGGTIVTAGTLRGTVAAAFGANTGAAAISLGGGTLELYNNTATTFTNTNTTVTASTTVSANRSSSAGTSTTHTLGTLSIGASTLNVTRGGNITGTATGGITFGATTMTGNATFAPAANAQLNLGAVGGAFKLAKAGEGSLVLTAAGTYSGGTDINNGSVQVNNNTAAGTGLITLNPGGTTTATRLLINGGVTIANPATITGSIFGVAGQGSFQQTGTGQARINGAITINGSPSAGGHFVAGTAVGNELVLGGPITTSIAQLNHRAGRVVYAGGGTGGSWTSLLVTDTALVGANNGIPTGVSVTLGGSASAALDLNGFNQQLNGLTVGNTTAASNFVGTVTLGANTLTLTGNITSQSDATQNVTHLINATAGGAINFGATNRTITLPDTVPPDDMIITGAALNGSGGVTKAGLGTLALNNTTGNTTLTVSEGTLQTGTFSSIGSATLGGLNLGAGSTLRMKVGVSGDSITLTNPNGLTVTGAATVDLIQVGGALAVGAYPFISYSGAGPGVANLALNPVGHATANLIDTGTAITLNVTANDKVVWDGTNSTAWATGATGNWKLQTGGTQTDFITGDDVVFQDSPTNNSVAIAASVVPSNVTFTNTTTTAYTLTGAAGIGGVTGLSKTGDGIVTISNPNTYTGATSIGAGTLNLNGGSLSGTAISVAAAATLSEDTTGSIAGASSLTTSGSVVLGGPNTYTGATTINAGTLELDANSGTLANTSGVSVATGATFRITRDGTATNTNTTFSRNLSGAGNLDVNIRDTIGTTASDALLLTGANSGFSGPIRLLAPAQGTYRLQITAPSQVGTGSIEVQSGTQMYVSGANTYTNNITIAGTGYTDTNGNIGALRLDNATWAGNVTVDAGGARIGSHNSTGTISGNISGGNLEFNATNYNNSYTTILTGTNTYGTTTIGGQNTQTSGTPSMRLNIGNGGTTGTLGTGSVTINGDSANGVLGFDRSDGYTLLTGQSITGGGSTITRTFIDFDTQGAGFSDNGNFITLGTAAPASGGNIRLGQSRANTVTNITGTMTAEKIQLGGQAVGINATMNIGAGANIAANYFTFGEAANATGGVVNQTAGNVNVVGQLRAGHFGTETATYNLSGGSVTLTGDSPFNTPSTAGPGGASATGDNNINALATATIHGGGVYLGIDGQGIFNHTGGTLTTNWIVLDNRGASGAGANMVDGIDRYNLSGATSVLNLRSTWGLIGRNEGSYAVSFGGGTVRVDNTGTGTGTGIDITIPLDATIDTVASTTTNLDTNGASNGFTLTKDVRGTGTLNLTGGGNVNLSTTGYQNIAATLASSGTTANLVKLGTGTTALTGNASAFTGSVTVSAGRLNLPASLATTVTVADGAALGGEPTAVASLTLGSSTGSTLAFDPNTPGAITAGALTVIGTNLLEVTAIPVAVGPWTAINYTTKSGSGTFAAAGTFRVAPVITDTGSAITMNLDLTTLKALTWSGAASNVWDTNNAVNWNDAVPAAEKFFTGDSATFPEGGANPSITLTGVVAPSAITVNAATTAYTLTSTAGNQIAGPTGITKTGAGSLTLAGPNIYTGQTSIGGGTLNYSAANSLGDGSSTNTIALSGGGRLIQSGAAAVDLGINRAISVGVGGGALSHNNATAANITIGGNLSGSGPLSFHSAAAGAGTFILAGNNSGYTGNITVDAPAAVAGGLTTLRIANTAAAPGGGSITLNFPAAGATGNATTLDLPNVTLPAGVALNMTSLLSGSISLRSQVTSSGNSTINGPITMAGTSIVQFNQAAGGTLTYNGNISETSPGSFTNTFFLRGSGTHIVNGTINLPTAGATLSVTDGATAIINSSTGNTLAAASAVYGTLRLGANDALGTSASLLIGQAGDQACTLDLNGFNQTVGSISFAAPTGNLTTKGISNSHATATSTFTVNQAVDASFNGTLTGRINLIKGGANSLTLQANASTFSGNVTVNNGTLVASGLGAATGANGSLGAANVAGKTVTVNSPGILSFTSNNIFGNGVGNTSLPAVFVNGGTLTSTRYNVLGDLTLNGGTLTQSATDGGGNEGYQFRGTVTVGGTSASTISTGNGKANHLAPSTTFNVADATASAAVDLLVSAPLRNPSADFAGETSGALVKEGPGTMSLDAANTYSGATKVTGGILSLGNSLALQNSPLDTLNSVAGDATNGLQTTVTTLTVGGLTGNKNLADVFTTTSGGYGSVTALTLNPATGATPSYSGNIADGAAGMTLAKIGSGTQILAGVNTYTGTTSVTTGTLQLDGSTHASSTVDIGTAGALTGSGTVNGNATLTGSGIINKSSGTIAGTLGVTGGNWNGAGSVTGLVTSSSDTFTVGSGANLTADGDLAVTGGTIAAGNATSTITGSVNYTSGSNSSFAGVIAGSGKTLTMNSSGAVLTLSGANTYTGATTVTAGTLVAANATALGTTAAGTQVASGATLHINGVAIGAEALTIDGTGVGGAGALTGAGTSSLAGAVTLGSHSTIGGTGTLTLSGGVGGGYNLTKTGSGTVELSGTNGYSGTTTVTNGRLKVSGTILNTVSPATIGAATATLELAGTGPVTPIGLDVSNVGTLEIATAAQELGDITGAGTTNVKPSAGLTANSIVQDTLIIGAGGSVTIRSVPVAAGGAAGANAVPEPGTWILIVTAVAGWLAFRRRC